MQGEKIKNKGGKEMSTTSCWSDMTREACDKHFHLIRRIEACKIEYLFGITLLTAFDEEYLFHAVLTQNGLLLRYEDEPLIEKMIIDFDNFSFQVKYQDKDKFEKLNLPNAVSQVIKDVQCSQEFENLIQSFNSPLSVIKDKKDMLSPNQSKSTKRKR